MVDFPSLRRVMSVTHNRFVSPPCHDRAAAVMKWTDDGGWPDGREGEEGGMRTPSCEPRPSS